MLNAPENLKLHPVTHHSSTEQTGNY